MCNSGMFPDGREIVKRGTMEGLIAKEIKGNNGFGYDPIVYLPEYGKLRQNLIQKRRTGLVIEEKHWL